MQSLYERDFTQWLSQQRDLLANKRFEQLDLDNLLEALEYQVGNNLDSLESQLSRLIKHLLKYAYQKGVLQDPWVDYMLAGWSDSIIDSREQITILLKKYPSLNPKINNVFIDIYTGAKNGAIKEMNKYSRVKKQKLTQASFPETCPWNLDKVREDDWYPDTL
ncbi:DUF29 domain-containing protein [Endozoicomonas sp. ONNA1]|uniref:DUF29 domain-containing protein n=1 Tax=Endozoicomonas sp. ONNA1 TaxID=2828740 RepID=UPI002147CB60|nr:DUF29 domain-containing protein [Endozoicomonas sp. ONNA1]